MKKVNSFVSTSCVYCDQNQLENGQRNETHGRKRKWLSVLLNKLMRITKNKKPIYEPGNNQACKTKSYKLKK